MQKKCIRCGNDKELDDFYIHPQMRDGYLNKCKTCCKELGDLREKELRQNDPEWCEKERLRSLEKYHRLGYNNRQQEIKKSKPYINGKYKNLARDLKLSSDENSHHWNYNLIEDVIILDKKLHRFIHRHLILNNETLMFESKDGVTLDTKEKHLDFINELEILYNQKYGKEDRCTQQCGTQTNTQKEI